MFRQIGQYQIQIEGDIINLWSSAEFNVEAARDYALAMVDVIAQMKPPFGVLTRFDGAPVLAAEVEASVHETGIERARRGMRAVAFVTPDEPGLSVARSQWARIYAGTPVVHAFFHDEDSARAWLRGQLDRLKSSPG